MPVKKDIISGTPVKAAIAVWNSSSSMTGPADVGMSAVFEVLVRLVATRSERR